ncbi:MAG: acyl-CoA dehydrogenase family protein [Paracoccaceae bacterium]
MGNRAYIDNCIMEAPSGKFDPMSACIAKLRATDTLKQVAAAGVQFRGASGISGESGERATQDMIDSAVQSIWGGTSEIMRDVIGRSLASAL